MKRIIFNFCFVWLAVSAFATPVNEAMTVGGTTLQSQSRAIDAKEILMKRKITAAPVVDENGKLTGAINLQDFYQAGII